MASKGKELIGNFIFCRSCVYYDIVSHAKISFVMKFIRLIFTFPLSLFLTHCQSPTDQINEAFKTVDKSLEKSNSVLNNSIEGLYSTINSNRQKNQQLALKADSIYLATSEANNFIDSLKLTMRFQDTSGTNLDLATKLFVFTSTGDDLAKVLLKVYANTNSYKISSSKRQELDSMLQSFREIQSDKQWTKKYFEATPIVAAITILSKFQNDCTNAATFTLDDIKKQLVD